MKIDKTTTFFTSLFIVLFAIFAVNNILNSKLLEGLSYMIIAILIAMIYAIYVISLYIDKYHKEVELLRKDLANLNREISQAFDAVDNNFAALVHAIDDFAAELEGEDQ